jgi:hypothetical protein
MAADLDDIDPPPLHDAATFAPLGTVRQRIRQSNDVDALWQGRTALWEAVMLRRDKVALALVQAGADPWRVMIGGWSPGRLNLAGPKPALFGEPPDGVDLSPQEQATVEESRRLIAAIGSPEYDGCSFAFIAGIDAAEVRRRLNAERVDDAQAEAFTAALLEGPWDAEAWNDGIVGVTGVPGGSVVGQWWNHLASAPDVMSNLTAGTIGCSIFGHMASGTRGSTFRDGAVVGWDTTPGSGQTLPEDPPEEVLRTFLYQGHPIPYCCNYAGLHLTETRAFSGPPDLWLQLPPVLTRH